MSTSRGAARVAVGTIASRTFLPFVRVLVDSLRRFHPDVPFVLALAEPEATPPDCIDWCEAVPIDVLGLPPLDAYREQYTLSQIVISAKPYLLQYLLDRGFERAVFLDCDILVLSELSQLLRPVRHAPIQVTPHVLCRTGRIGDEMLILRSGVFNGGFLGVEESAAGRRFLEWLQQRLATHCRDDLAKGLHYDQRWLDFVPALFPGTRIERDPGANVAYWNLHERELTLARDGEVLVNGGPARFFHFSGYDPSKPEQPTKYRPRLDRRDLGCAATLFDRYAELLRSAGWRTRPWRDAPGA